MAEHKRVTGMRILVGVLILMVIIFAFLGPVRKMQASKKAEEFARAHPVDTEFPLPEEIPDRQALANELIRLIRWEYHTETLLDRTYPRSTSRTWQQVRDGFRHGGNTKAETLYREALEIKWSDLRNELDVNTRAAIAGLYSRAHFPENDILQKKDVDNVYQQGDFPKLYKALTLAEGSGETDIMEGVYPRSTIFSSDTWKYVYLDLAAILWPDRLKSGCEAYLQQLLTDDGDKNILLVYELKDAVHLAEIIQERYGLDVSGEEDCRQLADDMERKKEEEREAAEKAEAARKNNSFGKSSSYGSSGSTYSDEIDPDDYDLEGYYEDYRDEFEDIDDAYDAFLDDEDAWEDY